MVDMKSESTFSFVLQLKFSSHSLQFLSHLKVTFFFSQRESRCNILQQPFGTPQKLL